jgi:hypothetical protein
MKVGKENRKPKDPNSDQVNFVKLMSFAFVSAALLKTMSFEA